MIGQRWERFHIKNTDKGPMVWEAKAVRQFWLMRDGHPCGPYWLIVARNVLDPSEVKYFLSNAPADTRLETLLHVGFARWPVERCFEDTKTELGLSHFEVRTYQGLCRHFFITQLSHLFLAEQAEQLRKKNPEITVCQVRTAADALIDALPLPPDVRRRRLERVAENLRRTQSRNRTARISHTQTRRRVLHRRGIFTSRLRTCIPP